MVKLFAETDQAQAPGEQPSDAVLDERIARGVAAALAQRELRKAPKE